MLALQKAAQLAFVGLASVAVYSFVTAARDGERRRLCTPLCQLDPDYAARSRTAPDFELPVLGGGTVRLSSLRGKTVVLNFWTKTCAPCLEEMPALAELARALRNDPSVVFLTVSTDDSLDDVRDTLRSVLGAEPPFVAAVDPESRVVRDLYGTRLYPETWLVDPRGVIRARFDGPRPWGSPLVPELVRTLREPLACTVEVGEGRTAAGPTCDDVTG